jgi:hypothetical protein
MGPLGLSQIQFVDVDIPSLPLIVGGSSGKGAFFSSIPYDTPINYETQDFQGVLLPGWEVILYRNEVLIDRKTSNTSGLYSFKDVALLYGRNVFKLSFFGPHGERREELKTLDISSDLIRAGKSQYWMSLAGVKPDEKLPESRERLQFQFSHGVSQHLSVSTGFFQERGALESFGYLGVAGANSLFFFSTNCAFGTRGGKACEWGVRTGFEGIELGTKYARYFDFKSRLINNTGQNQDGQLNANTYFVLPTSPSIGMTWEYERKAFVGGTSSNDIKNRLSSQIGAISINHEFPTNRLCNRACKRSFTHSGRPY